MIKLKSSLNSSFCQEKYQNISIVVVFMALYGCTNTVYLPPTILSTNTLVGQDRELYITAPFIDKRNIRTNCGVNTVCDIDPVQWITNLFILELRDSGFVVITNPGRNKGNIPKIEGSLLKIYTEPLSGSLETDIHIVLSVTTNSGFKAQRTFYVKGTEESSFLHSNPIILMHQSFLKATQKVVSDMRNAVIELMDDNFCVGTLMDRKISKYTVVEDLIR